MGFSFFFRVGIKYQYQLIMRNIATPGLCPIPFGLVAPPDPITEAKNT